ncbi:MULTISPECIES: type II toxin-antitoxin system Phd/YefM family antitoxin [unclassified Synechococcus]|uniref:type II toxin-antitoxin system Phd/YefM family antitoxin n=1 Tax=unclassified Synechococcus TaxID=2626047 RepID=UPI0020CB909B|nr:MULTISPECIES: type II toxin-antitoxin system prevent-host-death family antitoxin [unclassified Synechococcus]
MPRPSSGAMVNVQEAKTHLSALLLRVVAGEEIVLAHNGKPCARLVPLSPSPPRRLGFLAGTVDESFFEPLPESELAAWGA